LPDIPRRIDPSLAEERTMAARNIRGFTLIEVMVVVVIIGVLAAIAIPGFNDQIRKSRRAEIQGVMEQQRLRLEKHRVDNASYATYSLPSGTSTASYNVTLTGTGPGAYTLTATPVGSQAADKCGTMTLVNTAGVISQSPANCW
jgi:type IV pilus assembly protein PilE